MTERRHNTPPDASAFFHVVSNEGGSLSLEIGGDWTHHAGAPADYTLTSLLGAVGKAQPVLLDAAAVKAWDTSLLAFLYDLHSRCRTRRLELQVTGLAESARRLYDLATGVPPRLSSRDRSRTHRLAQLGNFVLNKCKRSGEAVTFLGDVVLALGRVLTGKARIRARDVALHVQECGPEALPIVTIISVLVGMIVAFLGAAQLQMFGAQVYVADLVGVGMAREMGALMTAIIMAGRTGAAFAAGLGTMQVNEEIDALKTIGVSSTEFLVLPRMLALILMMPLLVVYSTILGILGGGIIGVGMLDLTFVQYVLQTQQALAWDHMATGLIKGTAFGVVIAVGGCLEGLRCGRNAEAVGRATTDAVVSCILFIIIVDSILNIVFMLTGF